MYRRGVSEASVGLVWTQSQLKEHCLGLTSDYSYALAERTVHRANNLGGSKIFLYAPPSMKILGVLLDKQTFQHYVWSLITFPQVQVAVIVCLFVPYKETYHR